MALGTVICIIDTKTGELFHKNGRWNWTNTAGAKNAWRAKTDRWTRTGIKFDDQDRYVLLTCDIIEQSTESTIKVMGDEVIQQLVEVAHMAGQADAGVDPSYSQARAYYSELLSEGI